jgi:membrane protein implicated in regulation of membrane protease activity
VSTVWGLIGEYWRLAVVGGTGLLVLALRRHLPRWVLGAWGLLAAAVGLAWLVDLSWPGTLVVYVAMVFIAAALWLRSEERQVPGRSSQRS